jgi:zinc D-Ala-D-Ala carboxypeptidase
MIGPCKADEVDGWRWQNFTPAEFACSCCGTVYVSESFMDRLQALRSRSGVPMPISSGYRCPDHNATVSGTGRDGPHTTGRAADVAVSRQSAFIILGLAFDEEFTGIGVKQKGNGRFLHLDDLDHNRPALWSY